jgi:hypothetical protein
VLLVIIWVLSGFLDNIAAALIGGTVAASVFKRKVHIGYLAAIVAASNAGGAGSVVGDTTTTMMWIAGVSPLRRGRGLCRGGGGAGGVRHPGGAAAERHQAIVRNLQAAHHIDWARVGIVGAILVGAIATNVTVNLKFAEAADHFPFLGVAVWVVLLAAVPLSKPEWSLLPDAIKGSIFLLALVTCASMMPVEKLPPGSWQTALSARLHLGGVRQHPAHRAGPEAGGLRLGLPAYAVGFGGSMLWFGSSAGVAVANLFPEAKSVGHRRSLVNSDRQRCHFLVQQRQRRLA